MNPWNQPPPPGSLRERAERVPGPVRHALLFGTLLLAGVWAWTWSGPYRWLVELQSEHLGHYYPVPTFLLLWLGMALPASWVVYPWALERYGALTPEQVARNKAREARALALLSRWEVKGLILGVTFLGIGAFSALKAWSAGALVDASVSALAADQHQSGWVRIPLDTMLLDAAVVEERGRSSTWTVPLADAEHPGAALAVFVAFSTTNTDAPELPLDGEGVVATLPLSNEARTILEEGGVPVAEHTVVVDLDEAPGELWFMAKVFGLLGGALAAVCGLVFARRRA